MKISVPAKINLHLLVKGILPDGYHCLETVFQEIGLRDELIIEKKPGSGLNLKVESESGFDAGPVSGNIIVKTYNILTSFINKKLGVNAVLKKNIPVGAGLGGGSGDAAGFIRGANKLFKLRLIGSQEREIASKAGADAPFFLTGGCAVGLGRGDKIIPIDNKRKFWIVLLYPGVFISTKHIYESYDADNASIPMLKMNNKRLTISQNINSIKQYLESEKLMASAEGFRNDFENVVVEGYPEVRDALSCIRASGNLIYGGISGSGSSVFALFYRKENAEMLYDGLKGSGYKHLWLTCNESAGIVIG